MNRVSISVLLTFAALPAVAQTDAGEAVGAGVGLVLGLVIAIIVGAIVGWLASLIVKGSGSGFWTDVLIGIGGSLLASFIFPALGLGMGTGIIGSLIPAIIGAVILLLIIRLIRRSA